MHPDERLHLPVSLIVRYMNMFWPMKGKIQKFWSVSRKASQKESTQLGGLLFDPSVLSLPVAWDRI